MEAKKRGKNLNYLRSSNQGSVIKTILVSGSASRQILADKLGLTKMSITYLTSELLEKKIILEKQSGDLDIIQNNPGKKPAHFFLSPDSLYAIGVYISRDTVNCSISDITGEVKRSIVIKLDAKTTKLFLSDIICAHVRELLDEFGDKRILGIGVASIGLVDTRSGIVISTTEFYGVADWNIRDILEEEFSLPVFVVEDMKSASLAESYYGVARGLTDFVYLGVTHGIGAGVIINEKLFEGNQGFSGEIGHISINHRGKKCTCGHTGCMELYLSVPILLKKSGLGTWQDFLSFCDDDVTNPILEQFIRDMGIALTNIINLFDPQAVVIGHEGALLNRYCFEKLQIQADNYAFARRVKKVSILPSSLVKDIPHIGPSSIVFLKLFQGIIQI